MSEGHPLSSSSLLGRDADGMGWMGHIFRVPPLAFPPSFIRDIGLVPTGLRDSVHSFLYPGPPPSALRTLGPRLTGHSIVKKGFLRAPWGKCGAIGHPEVITRIIIPDPWGTEQEVSHPGAVAEPSLGSSQWVTLLGSEERGTWKASFSCTLVVVCLAQEGRAGKRTITARPSPPFRNGRRK